VHAVSPARPHRPEILKKGIMEKGIKRILVRVVTEN